MRRAGVPVTRIGRVTGAALDVQDAFHIPLGELRAASEGTLPRLFGSATTTLASSDHRAGDGSAAAR